MPHRSGSVAEAKNIEALRKTWQHLPAELQHMLEQDMTLEEAVAYHQKHWGFYNQLGFIHDVSHVLVGLTGIKKYQGTDYSEAITLYLQDILIEIIGHKKGVVDQFPEIPPITEINNHVMPSESLLHNVLIWEAGKKTGLTREAFKVNNGYPPFGFKTKELSKNVKSVKLAEGPMGHHVSYGWQVVANDGQVYNYNPKLPQKTVLPKGSNGVEDFHIDWALSKQDQKRLLRCLKPLIAYISEQPILLGIASEPFFNSAYHSVKIRDVFAVLPPMQTVDAAHHLEMNSKKERQRG
jgi:hypothetical protein